MMMHSSPSHDAEIIEGARVILSDRVEVVSVRIEGGRITGLDVARDGARVIAGKGRVLAPAFVDVHGDAFERQLMPRPSVMVPTEAALLETDRQLAANGIATAYHALTLSWEPGLRSVETGWQVLRALESLRPRLTVENRVQLRWEPFCPEAEPLIAHALGMPERPALAFNDHTSGVRLHPSIALHDRPFALVSDYPVTDLDAPGFLAKMGDRAKRAHMSREDFVALIARVWDRRPGVGTSIARMADLAKGAPMLSHDDSQIETRSFYRGLGANIAEFPMHERVFLAARAAGDWIVLGAPNAMRGGSHLDRNPQLLSRSGGEYRGISDARAGLSGSACGGGLDRAGCAERDARRQSSRSNPAASIAVWGRISRNFRCTSGSFWQRVRRGTGSCWVRRTRCAAAVIWAAPVRLI